jgi:hypothetical protein
MQVEAGSITQFILDPNISAKPTEFESFADALYPASMSWLQDFPRKFRSWPQQMDNRLPILM